MRNGRLVAASAAGVVVATAIAIGVVVSVKTIDEVPDDGDMAACQARIDGADQVTRDAALRIGVAVSGPDGSEAALDDLTTALGESPSIVMTYADFDQPAPVADLERFAERGATLLVTWEPWRWGDGAEQPDFRTARILAGDFDPQIWRWGAALSQWDGPVLIRYGHEMNADTYPWSDLANGNRPGDFVAGWRHVHDLVASAGATNVSWVWSPNVPFAGTQPLGEAYPGADYVDYVALDGYNWGTTQTWSSWISPCTLFDAGLAEVRALAPGIPILIAETGSAEQGGDKAEWHRQLIGYLDMQADVAGVILFNQDKETDWRIASSAASLTAFAEAIASRRTP